LSNVSVAQVWRLFLGPNFWWCPHII